MFKINRVLTNHGMWLGVVLTLLDALPAEAYVDPGTTGMLSQLLYVLFYGFLGLFLYCLRYIKTIVARGRQVLTGLFRRPRENAKSSSSQ
jgi:hypothetical protein